MKLTLILATLLVTTRLAFGQGTLVYDQQSTNLIEGARWLGGTPMGQSFTPSLSAIGFIELDLFGNLNDSGTTVFVNIRSNSITGSVLGQSSSLFIPTDFFGVTNFSFATPVALTPDITYYFEPIQLNGDVSSYITDGLYAGGSLIFQGNVEPDHSLWFREGILEAPEPTSAALLFTGLGALFYRSRQWHFRRG